ncbi:precorrin-2 C20-methyltransferase [Candidatus Omnitrophus magneticus]|uniref:Precorrin-2 C20-methyltransferase n=1 Tax=Candidatus Omnitrophus magneticus TaxID=1609969 RepID=A0A0F0CV79_9BACT|nr:precorrin-2 C20-methyltransferase [Candidatus Omnitrophus magneticus]
MYSIGLGPGDPDLVTVKASKILAQSNVIIVPQSDKTGRSVAKEIVSYYVNPDVITMYHFPMNNNKEELNARYSKLACHISDLIEDKKIVSFVTLGDPTIYSTSNYLTDSLKKLKVEIQHIPGISSINAVSSRLGLPLCVKGENFAVYELPFHVDEAVQIIERHSSVVFLKVNKKLDCLMRAVQITAPAHAYMIRRIGLDGEELYNLLDSSPSSETAYLSVALIRRRLKT